MKKIFLTILILTLANCAYSKDYSQMCASNSAKKTFGGNIASAVGFNSLSRNIIESQIAKAIKKETGSKFDIKINSFWGSNILNGEFKSLTAKSKEYAYDGMYLSNVDVETICPYNHIEYKDETLYFKENMVLKYKADITQKDLDKITNSAEFKKIIDEMNNDIVISTLFKIQSSKLEIKNSKLVLNYDILPFPKVSHVSILRNYSKPLHIAMGANLKAADGKLELVDLSLNSKSAKYSNVLSVINKLNPLSYNIDIDKNNKGTLDIDSVKIDNSKISIDGTIFIPKNK